MSNVIFLQVCRNVGNLSLRPLFGKPYMFEDVGVGFWLLLGAGGNDHPNVAMLSKKCLVRSDTRVAR